VCLKVLTLRRIITVKIILTFSLIKCKAKENNPTIVRTHNQMVQVRETKAAR
jgi:hypothetical protein